jgi:hypothetical protein
MSFKSIHYCSQRIAKAMEGHELANNLFQTISSGRIVPLKVETRLIVEQGTLSPLGIHGDRLML